VAARGDGTRRDLIAAADRTLYEARRSGEDRTIRGTVDSIDVGSGG
jgi:PleD family two-component response regulator